MDAKELTAVITDRMAVWFTPQMLAPESILMARLEELVAEYDEKSKGLTVGRFDEIMAESDKIQAELFRRIIQETMSEKPKGVRKVGQDTGQQKHATCTDCGAKLSFYKKDVKTGSGCSMGEMDTWSYIVCPECKSHVTVRG